MNPVTAPPRRRIRGASGSCCGCGPARSSATSGDATTARSPSLSGIGAQAPPRGPGAGRRRRSGGRASSRHGARSRDGGRDRRGRAPLLDAGLRIGLAEDFSRARLVPVGFEAERAGRARFAVRPRNAPAGQGAGELGDVLLGVAGSGAERVQLHDLARQVLVEPSAGELSRRWRQGRSSSGAEARAIAPVAAALSRDSSAGASQADAS